MLKSKVLEELSHQSISMTDLIAESEEQYPEFSILRELFEQFTDELKAVTDD